MNKISIAVAALIGTASANQWIVDPSKFDSFAQTTAGAAAASGSGVRAKWIELPNCQSLVIESATGLEYEPTFGEVIPLADDLSNAIIANCKGPSVAKGISTPQTPTPITTNVPVPQSQIFDDVWKTDTVIPDAEHQVSQLQHGKVDFSDQTSGPTGDF